MNPQKLKKLAEIFNKDLTGWQIVTCHFLELAHGLMGTFPAINKNNEIIATLDKRELKNVWKRLKQRPAMVTSFIAVVHIESGIAFSLESPHLNDGRVKPFRIFSAEDIKDLCKNKKNVSWAPGLYGECRPSYPVFT